MLLINCEINLILTWSAICGIITTDAPNQRAIFSTPDRNL